MKILEQTVCTKDGFCLRFRKGELLTTQISDKCEGIPDDLEDVDAVSDHFNWLYYQDIYGEDALLEARDHLVRRIQEVCRKFQ